jgi:hypothetical protein
MHGRPESAQLSKKESINSTAFTTNHQPRRVPHPQPEENFMKFS